MSWYSKRKAAGLCVNCPAPAEPGMVRCAGCAANNNRRGAAYRKGRPLPSVREDTLQELQNAVRMDRKEARRVEFHNEHMRRWGRVG